VLGEDLPDRITHRQIIRIAMEGCGYASLCRFSTFAIEEAAAYIPGEVAMSYPLEAETIDDSSSLN
jgi:hypothetical protein